MEKITKFTILISVLLVLVVPTLSFANFVGPCPPGQVVTPTGCVLAETNTDPGGLVPCTAGDACNFDMLMVLVNRVINFILVEMAIPIAAIMMAYAGFLLVTAGGEAAGARTKAKSIFTNAVFGLAIAFAAWLIVKLILTIVGFNTTLLS